VIDGAAKQGSCDRIWSAVRSRVSSLNGTATVGRSPSIAASRTLLLAKTRIFADFVVEAFKRDQSLRLVPAFHKA
jgi:hypothetical protein